MTIQEFKQSFFTSLSSLYPQTEIQSFFNLLILFKFKLTRVEIAFNQTLEIELQNLEFLQNSLTKLKNQIPIQYIIGETEFYGLQFIVDSNVLIPRPETEELVNWIIQENDNKKPLKILDIGSGSGCIAISLAKFFPKAEVTGIDISTEALKIADKNAELNGVSVRFLEINILTLPNLHQNFDIIVSNPPYVRESEKTQMQDNVLINEPHLALFVKDNNPLMFYDKIAELAFAHLASNGSLYFEINQYLGTKMTTMLQNKGFKKIELRKDFYDVDRMMKATII